MSDRSTIYIFDSDVLISAHRRYYNFSFAGSFWEWLKVGIEAGIFYSANNVKKELENSVDENDYLLKFAKSDDNLMFWKQTDTNEIIEVYAKLQNWAMQVWAKGKSEKDSALLSKALSDFADEKKADAWLVALAIHLQIQNKQKTVIVTHEQSSPASKKRIMLPDVAKCHELETITLFELLKKYSGNNFKFKQ